MKVKELLSIKGLECFSITSDQSMLDASKQMTECNIGALLVMDRGALAGIVTERDVVKAAANEQKPLKDIKLKDSMSTNLLVVKPGDDLDYVMAIMIQNNIRHTPVVEASGLMGLLSMRDVVRVLVKNLKAENHYLKDMIGGKLGELGD
ncbi:MAG TPA: CBS domain-containing protein [Nitrospirota bacterium]|nr:CBS domain-containing protein [Nitrospirota bacterium]